MSEYRYEYKYIIDSMQESILLSKAKSLLKLDSYAVPMGYYSISSLYFDDYDSRCLLENYSGIDLRSKYRMRYYNNVEHIYLEKKSKIYGKTHKQSCLLRPAEAESLVKGSIPEITNDLSMEKKSMFLEMKFRNLIPQVIVSYDRIPFIYPVGNVRITFDKNITSSNEISRFLQGSYRTRPVMPEGNNILEVKWETLLPVLMKEILQTDNLQWTSFSKYCMCRLHHL